MQDYNFKNCEDSKLLSNAIVEMRDALAENSANISGLDIQRSYSSMTDAFIKKIYELSLSNDSLSICSPFVAIAAVGGYGRNEMSPFSDIDVAFITDGQENEITERFIKRAFRLLMDAAETANLKVGYSYRNIEEIENLSVETQTSLLDCRYIVGSEIMFINFALALKSSIIPASFIRKHIALRSVETLEPSTPFCIQPNIKDGCGGLRDLQTARWISQVTFNVNGNDVWQELRALGIIDDTEIVKINQALEAITRIRNFLHLTSNGAQENLTFRKQLTIARAKGIAGSDEEACDKLMALYFKHASQIRSTYLRIAEACLNKSLWLEPGVKASDNNLIITDSGLLARDNTAIMRMFTYMQDYNLKLDRRASDVAASFARTYRTNAATARSFIDILSSRGVSSVLRSMSEAGVLHLVIPDFAKLMYTISGDEAHAFTVGEHSIRTVEELEKLFSEQSDFLPDVISRLQNPDILFLAALVHDIGKIDNRRDHCKTGASKAAKLASSLGLDDERAKKLVFLVRHHLKMSETARLRDLTQPSTVKDFAGFVKNVELLDMLLLLTIADSRAVGIKHWTQVQLRFLKELHERTYSALKSPEYNSADIEKHRKQISRELKLTSIPVEEVDMHCNYMPTAYLLNTTAEELALHIGFVKTLLETSQPIIDMKDDRAGEYTELTVVSFDAPGLLSSIAGTLSALGVDIHAAQIYTRDDKSIAIDKLLIDFEAVQLTQTKKLQLESELSAIITGRLTVSELFKSFKTDKMKELQNVEVILHDEVSESHSVIEIKTIDTAGLLYNLTQRIADEGLVIHSARVATWGHQARDVFYVTNSIGDKASEEQIGNLKSKM